MPTEHETKVLDIDVKETEDKLRKLGAKEEPEVLMKRWIFDMNPKGHEWVRLRDNGDKITIAYKTKKGMGISETEEIETEVKDFENAYNILSKLDFKAQYYRETKRRLFTLNGIEFTIDTFPAIPPMLEIEGDSEEKVKEGLKLLGLEGKDVGNLCLKKVCRKYGIDLDSIKASKF